MSDTKSVNVQVGSRWGLLLFAAGAVLRFATDPGTTWNGVHTQKAGDILMVVGMLPIIILLVLVVGAGILALIAGILIRIGKLVNRVPGVRALRQRRWQRKMDKRRAKMAARRRPGQRPLI